MSEVQAIIYGHSDTAASLTKVTEPNPAGGTWDTNYTYNAAGQLTQVSMPRGANTQTRTFNYNTSGQLTSSVNPETGTVTYTYNGDSTLATKTDAKNQKVEYVYDAYKRVTEVKRFPVAGGAEDTCQKTKYFYDVNTFDGSFSLNAWGRLVVSEYPICSPPAYSAEVDHDSATKPITIPEGTDQGSERSDAGFMILR